jgi:hypothetical protein
LFLQLDVLSSSKYFYLLFGRHFPMLCLFVQYQHHYQDHYQEHLLVLNLKMKFNFF